MEMNSLQFARIVLCVLSFVCSCNFIFHLCRKAQSIMLFWAISWFLTLMVFCMFGENLGVTSTLIDVGAVFAGFVFGWRRADRSNQSVSTR